MTRVIVVDDEIEILDSVSRMLEARVPSTARIACHADTRAALAPADLLAAIFPPGGQ